MSCRLAGDHQRLGLFAHNCNEDFPPVRGATVFEEENALPGSKLHFSVGNRNGLTGACKDHSDVRWHVIAAFGAVREVIGILGDESIEEFFQVLARSWIRVLHDDNAATGVLNKNSHCPIAHATLVDLPLHFVCSFVQPLTVGTEFKLVVKDAHM